MGIQNVKIVQNEMKGLLIIFYMTNYSIDLQYR